MRGDSAPPPARTDVQRRALAERLGQLQPTITDSPALFHDRSTEGHRSTGPASSTRRRSTPSRSRRVGTDTTVPQRPEVRDTVSVPITPPTAPIPPMQSPDSLARRIQGNEEALREARREIQEQTGREEARGTRAGRPISLERGTVSSQRLHPPLRQDVEWWNRRVIEHGIPAYRGPRSAQLPDPSGNIIRQYEESEDARRYIAPEFVGIGVGILRSVRDFLQSITDIIFFLDHYLENRQIEEGIRNILEMDREAWVEVSSVILELLNNPQTQLDVLREIGEALWEPFQRIGNQIATGIEMGMDGNRIESSASIIQATIGTLNLLAAVAEISRNLIDIRRLRRLSRRLNILLERTRRQIASSGVGRFGTELLIDERGAAFTGRAESPRPISAPHSLADGTPVVTALRRSLDQLALLGVDVNDPYTLERLNDIFARAGALPTEGWERIARRADLGELRTLMRYARQSDVQRVRFLRPRQAAGSRTPDIEVLRRGESQPEFVEVRTLTQESRYSPLPTRDVPDLWISDSSIEQKIFHGQISDGRPGTIVFHAPRSRMTETWLPTWQRLLNDLHSQRSFPAGLRRIEVTTGDGGVIVFSPPNWRGARMSR